MGILWNFMALCCITTIIQRTAGAPYYLSYEQSNCFTPNLELGICISIENCPSLYNMVRLPLTSIVTNYLRQSECAKGFTSPQVCCSDHIPQQISWYIQQGYIITRPSQNVPQQLPDTSNPNPNPNPQQHTYDLIPPQPAKPTPNPPPPTQILQLLPSPPHCGVPRIGTRILGGTETKIGELRWMAMIEMTNLKGERKYTCAGALINHRYVLTAAHCITDDGDWMVTSVRLGEWNTSTNPDRDCFKEECEEADEVMDIGVEKIIPHENYKENQFDNLDDIGLLRLEKKVTFSEYVRPICLPISDELRAESFENYSMIVAGWGATRTQEKSELLLKATVKIVDSTKCNALYRKSPKKILLRSSQLCAGDIPCVDAAKADSGGPLMSFRDNYYYVSGIVSMGPKNCSTFPGVYTRVTSYLKWIELNMYE